MDKPSFSNIILIGRAGVIGVPETLSALKAYLSSQPVNIFIEAGSASMLDDGKIPTVDANTIPSEADLIIVVGGDGSLLNASRFALEHEIPVLGINRGRLGFLTDIHPDHLEKVGAVLGGRFQEERRNLLQATLTHESKSDTHDIALNDVVLMPGDIAHMIEFEILVDQQFVCAHRADGLIIATPTGSTAYALSGGGPILHPQLNANVLVPMFPHTLSSRPIVVDNNSKIELFISPTNETSPYVSCDGLNRVPISPGGKVIVSKHDKTLRLIHPGDYDYYTTLREKLGWERQAKRH